MRAINHHLFLGLGFSKFLFCFLDAICIVVSAPFTTTENDEAVFVSGRANDCYNSRFGNRQEMMSALSTIDIIST